MTRESAQPPVPLPMATIPAILGPTAPMTPVYAAFHLSLSPPPPLCRYPTPVALWLIISPHRISSMHTFCSKTASRTAPTALCTPSPGRPHTRPISARPVATRTTSSLTAMPLPGRRRTPVTLRKELFSFSLFFSRSPPPPFCLIDLALNARQLWNPDAETSHEKWFGYLWGRN